MRLRLAVSRANHRRDLEVVAGPQDTIAGLIAALGDADPGSSFEVDAEPVDPGMLLSQIRSGSILAIDRRHDVPHAVARVLIVAGPDAGRAFALQPGRHTLGSRGDEVILGDGIPRVQLDVDADGSVRMWDARASPPCAPWRARNGAPVSIGQVVLRVSPPRNGQPGRGPLSRPPRPSPTGPPPEIRLPKAPSPGAPRPRIGWAALLAPMAMGAAMATLVNPMMALFALVGPLMLVAQWAEDRSGHRRRRRAAAAGLRTDLDRLRTRLESAAGVESERIRGEHPDLPEIVDRALTGHPSLWERLRGHHDFLLLSVGLGSCRWTPPIEAGSPTPEIAAVIEQGSNLALVPFAIRLEPGSGVGIVGTVAAACALARGLVAQAAVLHGPADLVIALLTTPDRIEDWEWLKWLPHCHPGAHIILGDESLPEFAPERGGPHSTRPLGLTAPTPPAALVVVDIVGPLPDEARSALTPETTLLFVTDERRNVPARCSTVIELAGIEAQCDRPGSAAQQVILAGVALDTADNVARALAGLTDPEAENETTRLPERVRLLELVEMDEPTAELIAERWARAGKSPQISATIGLSETGPVAVDLVADGPHGLVAGTTGSGKSELLRTLVASLALSADPDHLVFVLIDYKGGSAFDVCADLPHTVGLVTDLDERLAARALTCLEAELRYREERLRLVGASDLSDYWATGQPMPLPRLLVVIDEFAALYAEIPEFMNALLDIAQRGRSLGVHLLLATQRPAGVVSEGIKANTNIRIALRVHDQADSTDVLGAPDAARLGRHTPGRAFLRLGPADRVSFQTALVTDHAPGKGDAEIRVSRFTLTEPPSAPTRPSRRGPTDLERLVEAASAAAAGCAPPRRPWPQPLPERITRRQLDRGCFALADEPRHQRTVGMSHRLPAPLLIYGGRGSGTTMALVAFGLALASDCHPDQLHIYVLDFDSQTLGPLAGLPHTGAVIGAAERERQTRLLRFLRAVVERRRDAAASGKTRSDHEGNPSRIVLLLDGFQGFSSAFDAPADLVWKETLTKLMADGPGFGVTVIATADRPGAIPGPVAGLVADRLVFRLADPYDYAAFALRPPAGPVLPGRAIDTRTGLELQVGCFNGTLEEEVAAIAETMPLPIRPPPKVGVLPSRVSAGGLIDRARFDDREWLVPVGIGDDSLAPVNLTLAEGEPVLVAGRPRSGRSTILMTIAQMVGSSGPGVTVETIAFERSPLHGLPGTAVTAPNDAEVLCGRIRSASAPQVLFVDDAEMIDDPSGALARLLADRLDHVRVVIAGNADSLRFAYGHWTQTARRSSSGIILGAVSSADSDLWHRDIPAMPPNVPPGRGLILIDGRWQVFQAASP